MTATLQIITDAAVTRGVIDPIDPLPAETAQFILRRLNRMLDTWANEDLMVYNTYVDSFPLQATVPNYSTSLFSRGRPMNWDSGYIRMSNIDYDLEFISPEAYNAISYKPTPGIPTDVYIATDFPDSVAWFFPTPYASNMTAYFYLRGVLTPTLALADDLTLPPGYESAIVDNLAVDIGPSFGRPIDQELRDSATEKKSWLKRANHVPLEMHTDLPVRRSTYNIYSGR